MTENQNQEKKIKQLKDELSRLEKRNKLLEEENGLYRKIADYKSTAGNIPLTPLRSDRDASNLKSAQGELKETNASLRASEEKFTAFIEHSPDGIMMTDEKGIIQEWNSSMEHLTGISAAEARGAEMTDIIERIHQFNIGKMPDLQRMKGELKSFFRGGDTAHSR